MMLYMGRLAREAARTLALASTEAKNAALEAMAARIEAHTGRDHRSQRAGSRGRARQGPRRGLPRPAGARTTARVAAMAQRLARRSRRSPIRSGEVTASWTRPNGLQISRVRVPLGVIGIIYESRPNVTADAGGALPQIRQRRDPAQRLRELPHLARHRQRAERGPGRGRVCRKPRSSSCRRWIARRSASCSAALAAPST